MCIDKQNSYPIPEDWNFISESISYAEFQCMHILFYTAHLNNGIADLTNDRVECIWGRQKFQDVIKNLSGKQYASRYFQFELKELPGFGESVARERIIVFLKEKCKESFCNNRAVLIPAEYCTTVLTNRFSFQGKLRNSREKKVKIFLCKLICVFHEEGISLVTPQKVKLSCDGVAKLKESFNELYGETTKIRFGNSYLKQLEGGGIFTESYLETEKRGLNILLFSSISKRKAHLVIFKANKPLESLYTQKLLGRKLDDTFCTVYFNLGRMCISKQNSKVFMKSDIFQERLRRYESYQIEILQMLKNRCIRSFSDIINRTYVDNEERVETLLKIYLFFGALSNYGGGRVPDVLHEEFPEETRLRWNGPCDTALSLLSHDLAGCFVKGKIILHHRKKGENRLILYNSQQNHSSLSNINSGIIVPFCGKDCTIFDEKEPLIVTPKIIIDETTGDFIIRTAEWKWKEIVRKDLQRVKLPVFIFSSPGNTINNIIVNCSIEGAYSKWIINIWGFLFNSSSLNEIMSNNEEAQVS